MKLRAVALAAAIAVVTGCTSSAVGSTPNAGVSPYPVDGASIPLGINDGNKPGYHLTLSVGGAGARDFLLDTGSAGLWVYPNAIGKQHLRVTTYVVTNSYGSGLVYTGVLAYTQVDFGNGIVTGEVPVALVKSATCEPGMSCPAQAGSSYCPTIKPTAKDAGIACLENGRRLYGTFGAALSSVSAPSSGTAVAELYNVIFAIAHPWAHAFEVTPGALVVGPHPLDGYAVMHLTAGTAPEPLPLPNGAKLWERDVTLCYTVGTVQHYCANSLFDTGASNVSFQAKVKFPHSSSNCGTEVTPGTAFSAETEGGVQIASFDAGSLTNWDRVVTKKQKKSKPQVNTGMTLFNRNSIYYDAATGVVAIRPLATPVHVAQKACGTDSAE